MTFTPLPSWKSLFVGFISKGRDDAQLASMWLARKGDGFYWLSKSAWSLYLIVRAFERQYNRAAVVYLPDYFCNETLFLLKKAGAKLCFYDIDAAFEPNWNGDILQIALEKPDFFVLVHYFGSQNDIDGAARFCKKHACYFVEDAAHILLPFDKIGRYSDFTFYSQHKLLPIPNGALLCVSRNSPLKETVAKEYGRLADETPDARGWIVKRVMQKIFPDRFLKRFLGRAVSPEFDFDSSEFGVMEPKMSGYAKKLLFCELKNIERYAYQRRLNANVFSECFATALPILRYTVPYQYHAVLPLESARRIYAKIANANLYVQRWADIPKEIFADRDKHACAIDFAERSVFLPLHQDINEKHIFESYYKFRTVSHEYKTRVVNDELLWNKLLSKSKYSNLLQSWEYGETKLTSGWIVKRLLITDIDDNEVAICQALLKSFFGVGVVRINRGPILLDEAADKEALLCLLKKKLSLGIVTIFFAAFEFFDGPGVRFVLNRCGFWCRRIRGWSSGWIGLDVDMDHIRNAFDSKWRNQLKSAEHKNIIIVTVKNKDGYEEFITRYERFMIDRSFDGIRPDALRFLVNKYPSSLTAFEAFLDGVFYGGVLLHLHGRCATYLVGISSEEGRKTNTMNLLLWYAVAELKKRGFSSFDLGGIDTVATPSIAKFKRGLSPKEYTLTGEYVGFRFSLFASCGEGQ